MPISTSLQEDNQFESSLKKFSTDEIGNEAIWLHPTFCSASPVEFAILQNFFVSDRMMVTISKPIIIFRLNLNVPYKNTEFTVWHDGLALPRKFKIGEEFQESGIKLIEDGSPDDEVSFFIELGKLDTSVHIKFGEKDVLLADIEKKAIVEILTVWKNNRTFFIPDDS